MDWDWQIVTSSLPEIAEGLRTTIVATLFATVLALVLGLVWAFLMRLQAKIIQWLVGLVREFIQDTPILVQLFFVYFVTPQYLGIRLSALVTGILVLGVHFSTYMAEVYRAGIEAVPVGQWEACRALNFTLRTTWRKVILPQAVPPVLPALGNYVISLLKSTPQLLAIGVVEMLAAAQRIGVLQFRFLEVYTVVAVIFLLLSYPSGVAVRWLENRYGTVI